MKNDIYLNEINFYLVNPMKNSDFQAYYTNKGKSNLKPDLIHVHFVLKRSSKKSDAFKNGRCLDTWKKEGNKYITVCCNKVKESDREYIIQLMSNIASDIKSKYKDTTVTIIPPETSLGENEWKKEIK